MSMNGAFDSGPCLVTVRQNGTVCHSSMMEKGQSLPFKTPDGISLRIVVDATGRVNLYAFSPWSELQYTVGYDAYYELSVSLIPSYPANHARVVDPLFDGGEPEVGVTNADRTLPISELSPAITDVPDGSVQIVASMPAREPF